MGRRAGWRRAVALVALGLLGCGGRRPVVPAAPDPDVLTAADIGRAPETSVYEALQRLRPRFLQSRGPTSILLPSAVGPAVWVDGRPVGGVEWLRSVLPGEVATIRRLSAWDAATAYGSRFHEGVIVVTTHPAPREPDRR